MKKLILLALGLAICSSAFAQYDSPVKGLMIGAGVSFDHYNYKALANDIDVSDMPNGFAGFNVFVNYEYGISKIFSASAGLRFQMTSYTQVFGGVGNVEFGDGSIYYGNYSIGGPYNNLYVDLPLKAVFHFGGFFINLGPTFEFWVDYNQKYNNSVKDVNSGNLIKEESGIKHYFKQPGSDKLFNKFNVALGGELGYDWRHFRIYGGVDYDLIKTFKKDWETENKYNFNRMNIRVGVAYLF